MSDNVVKLPTASPSYITVRKARTCWDVVLCTPIPGRVMRVVLYSLADQASAILVGNEVAADMQRPFKMKGGKS